MKDYLKFYIDGQWVDPAEKKTLDVINPATEEPFARISMGSAKDVDKAVAAAKAAFPKFSMTTKQERIELLQSIMSTRNAMPKSPPRSPRRWARRRSCRKTRRPPWASRISTPISKS